jgi:hypothetical protein
MIIGRPKIESGRQFVIKNKGVLIETGNVYEYSYDPLHKERLKFYDRNPLMVFMEYHKRTNLLFGVNLHYIPLDGREDIVNMIQDFKPNIQREFRWELLYNDPRFYNLPLGFRKYFPNRMVNINKVIDMDNDVDIDREDLKFKKKSMVSLTGKPYNQKQAKKLSMLAKANKIWTKFLNSI